MTIPPQSPKSPKSSSVPPISSIFPNAKHYISKETYHNYFDASLPPALIVSPGDLIHLETNDCYHGKITPQTIADTIADMENNNQDKQSISSKQSSRSLVFGQDEAAERILSTIRTDQLNPVTGPIYIETAMPGDILAVRIIDIQPYGVGVACCSNTSGQLAHCVSKPLSMRFFDLTTSTTTSTTVSTSTTMNGETVQEPKLPQQPQKMVTMRDILETNTNSNDTNQCQFVQSSSQSLKSKIPKRLGPISFPASPMLGVIGVAPAPSNDENNDVISKIVTMPAGKHGGNLDNQNNGIGSTIYIPINHPGALLSMGDMHASQGDGEISGTGVEIAGHVLFTCHVLKQQDIYKYEIENENEDNEDNDQTITTTADTDDNNNNNQRRSNPLVPPYRLEYPVTETSTHWVTYGVVEENIPLTTTIACEEAAKLLVGQWGLTIEEAFIFLSIQGNLGLCQSCHPDRGTQIAKMSVPKLPNLCPKPFSDTSMGK